MSSAKANACVTSFVSVRSAEEDWVKDKVLVSLLVRGIHSLSFPTYLD